MGTVDLIYENRWKRIRWYLPGIIMSAALILGCLAAVAIRRGPVDIHRYRSSNIKIAEPQSGLHNPGRSLFLFPQFPPAGTYIFPLLFPYQWLHRRQVRMDMLAGFHFRRKDSAVRQSNDTLLYSFTEPNRDERRWRRNYRCLRNVFTTNEKENLLTGFVFFFHSTTFFYIELMFIITLMCE